MHDPSTLAFEVPSYAARTKGLFGWCPTLLDIWHDDPETDGTDDSCGWFNPGLSKSERTLVVNLIDNEYDNLRSFFPDTDGDEAKRRLAHIFICYKRFSRPWWKHPRWHFWHWRINVVPVQSTKRWLFSRCCRCGGRFRWGYAPTTTARDSDGPRWFRGEPQVFHSSCERREGSE